jgi:hypothetical protein
VRSDCICIYISQHLVDNFHYNTVHTLPIDENNLKLMYFAYSIKVHNI